MFAPGQGPVSCWLTATNTLVPLLSSSLSTWGSGTLWTTSTSWTLWVSAGQRAREESYLQKGLVPRMGEHGLLLQEESFWAALPYSRESPF